MSDELRGLLTSLPKTGALCSARIVDLETGQTLCEVNPENQLVPASNAKIFPIAAAIDQLGPEFAFRTVLARQGDDLVVIGSGDPALGDAKVAEALGEPADAVFSQWADRLQELGLTAIAGDLVIDESIFDDQLTHPTWEENDLKKWYAAPVGGLNYNDNCIDMTVWPAPTTGAPVLWEVVPKNDLIEVDNRCKSGHKGNPIIDRPKPTFRYVVSGGCTKRSEFPSVAVPDPGLLAASALRTALADRGISIAGDIQRRRVRLPDGSLPPDCRVLAEHSTALSQVLVRTGRDSQNLFAECLMKRLGYEWARRHNQPNPQGSWDTGRAAIGELLAKAGRTAQPPVVADASGLSRDNRASAADLLAVLEYMYRHPQRQLFVDSLSVAGENGSMRKRLKDLGGTIHAKTGYLRGVRTLSGYAVTPQGRWRAFSVLFNGFKGGSAPLNKVHDEVCRILATDPPGSKQ